jgi:hypothetical protein
VTLGKYFSHPSLVMYSFAIPPIKLKLALQIGGELLRVNHLDESLGWASQKYRAGVRSYLLLFYAGAQRCCSFHRPRQCAQLCGDKTVFVTQTCILWIFFIQFFCAGSHSKHRWRCSYNCSNLLGIQNYCNERFRDFSKATQCD